MKWDQGNKTWDIRIGNTKIQKVKQFCLLGNITAENNCSTPKIKRIISVGVYLYRKIIMFYLINR